MLTHATQSGSEPARLIRGWGHATGSHALVARPTGSAQWQERLAEAGPRGLIARGGGCSYGDAAQNAGGTVALTTGGDDLTRLVVADATVVADAGMTLGALIRALAPLRWTLPVVPGASGVTVGGAIAADVHGKNHVHTGTFGAHVREMTVLTPGHGEVLMSPTVNPGAFWATVGGLGLTGVIRQARLELVPLDSWLFRCTDTIATDLDAMLTGLTDASQASAYAVGWIDAVRTGAHIGAGVISHAGPLMPRRTPPHDGGRLPAPRVSVPMLPGAGIGTVGITAVANRLRLATARVRPHRILPLPEVLYPMDTLPGWPGLHGRLGLVQYQFVVPFGAEDVLRAALIHTRKSGFSATLAALKVFGAAGEAPLSFPLPGWSLALDFPARPRLARVLDALDERVAAAGGRVYLVKDSRLRPDLVSAMYPQLPRWRAERAALDPKGVMTSDLNRRLHLSEDAETGHA
ncbi:FAD-binding oxidoreductase [Actinoplanes sp. TBRC 11911]|uniref:FAD-dependent oxidoreductase n=1 Tax=Actinoplanes sp. TBRC 11911 TaxID=2729386 RepID=UPI00145DEAD0|nr:FAD-binding oxidoreductase [Actinoplanes sp. TBRC 11911]NMO53726.1 FAD-binding oxidoreductase [Actinoplanes sp. TBRC 11911]